MVESKNYGAPDYVFLLTLSSALVPYILNLCFPTGWGPCYTSIYHNGQDHTFTHS